MSCGATMWRLAAEAAAGAAAARLSVLWLRRSPLPIAPGCGSVPTTTIAHSPCLSISCGNAHWPCWHGPWSRSRVEETRGGWRSPEASGGGTLWRAAREVRRPLATIRRRLGGLATVALGQAARPRQLSDVRPPACHIAGRAYSRWWRGSKRLRRVQARQGRVALGERAHGRLLRGTGACATPCWLRCVKSNARPTRTHARTHATG